jgi:hypothetical protein
MSKEVGKLEQAEIDNLKSQHGHLYQIKVQDDQGDTHYCFVKKPTLAVIGGAASYAQTDPIKSGMLMYNTLKVKSTDGIENDDEMKLAVIGKIGEIFKVREAELEKL